VNEEDVEFARTACIWEVMARKLGNVHPRARFDDLVHSDFLRSADALAEALIESQNLGVGETILLAVRKRITVTRSNTNLGIILLLAPLVKSCDRSGLETLLATLTVEDARFAFEAIRIASAGGLGEVPRQSVADEPTVTLLDAMRLAADRDQIAKQYACGFADIFDFAAPHLLHGFEMHGSLEAAILECQLQWLAAFPDSLIARKCGMPAASSVQKRACGVLADGGLSSESGRASAVRFDAYLRSDGNRLNPGTTADLVTACLFIALRERKLKPSDPFPWSVSDWL
jgi:triphosphoribosyl-dephospho-CoA synthase